MFHPRCVELGDHNWDNWYWQAADANGLACKTFYTTYEGPAAYLYVRKCQNFGCDAVQRAKHLQPQGVAIFDTKSFENVLREHKIIK